MGFLRWRGPQSLLLFGGFIAGIGLAMLPASANAASVPFQGRLDSAPVSYQIDPGKRVIFGDILAIEMRKRSTSGQDLVRVTATNKANGTVVYNKRFALNGPRHIVFIDGFALGRSTISLCVDSMRLSTTACYAIDVDRVE